MRLSIASAATMSLVINNTAVAARRTPVAITRAQVLGCDTRPFIFSVLFAARARFSTPVGYRVRDFFRVGTPLNRPFWIPASLMNPVFWPFQR